MAAVLCLLVAVITASANGSFSPFSLQSRHARGGAVESGFSSSEHREESVEHHASEEHHEESSEHSSEESSHHSGEQGFHSFAPSRFVSSQFHSPNIQTRNAFGNNQRTFASSNARQSSEFSKRQSKSFSTSSALSQEKNFHSNLRHGNVAGANSLNIGSHPFGVKSLNFDNAGNQIGINSFPNAVVSSRSFPSQNTQLGNGRSGQNFQQNVPHAVANGHSWLGPVQKVNAVSASGFPHTSSSSGNQNEGALSHSLWPPQPSINAHTDGNKMFSQASHSPHTSSNIQRWSNQEQIPFLRHTTRNPPFAVGVINQENNLHQPGQLLWQPNSGLFQNKHVFNPDAGVFTGSWPTTSNTHVSATFRPSQDQPTPNIASPNPTWDFPKVSVFNQVNHRPTQSDSQNAILNSPSRPGSLDNFDRSPLVTGTNFQNRPSSSESRATIKHEITGNNPPLHSHKFLGGSNLSGRFAPVLHSLKLGDTAISRDISGNLITNLTANSHNFKQVSVGTTPVIGLPSPTVLDKSDLPGLSPNTVLGTQGIPNTVIQKTTQNPIAPGPEVSSVTLVSPRIQLQPNGQTVVSESSTGTSKITPGSIGQNVIQNFVIGEKIPSSSKIGQPQKPVNTSLLPEAHAQYQLNNVSQLNSFPSSVIQFNITSGIPSTIQKPLYVSLPINEGRIPNTASDGKQILSEPIFKPTNITHGSSTSNVIQGSPIGQSSPSSSKIGQAQQPATSEIFPNSDTVLFNGPTIAPQNTLPSSGIPSSPAWNAPSPAVVESRVPLDFSQIQLQPDRQPGFTAHPFGPSNNTRGSDTSNVIQGSPIGQTSPSSSHIGQPQQPATSGLFPSSDTVMYNGPTIAPQNTLPSSGKPSSPAWNTPIPSIVESRVPLELTQIQLQPDRQSVVPELPVGPSNTTPGASTSNVINGSPNGPTSLSSSQIDQPQLPPTSGFFPNSDKVLFNGPTITPQNTLPSSGIPSSPAWSAPSPAVVEPRLPSVLAQIQLQPDRQPGLSEPPIGPTYTTGGSSTTSNVIQGSPNGLSSPSSSQIGQPQQPATSGLFPNSDTVLFNGPMITQKNTLPSAGIPSSPAWSAPIPSVVESRVLLDFSQIQLQPDRQPGLSAHPFGPSSNTRGSDTSNVIQGSPIGQTSPSSSHIGQPQQPATSEIFPNSDTVLFNGPTIAPQNTLPSSGKPSSPVWNTPIPSVVESRVPLDFSQIQLQPDRQPGFTAHPFGPSNNTRGSDTSNKIQGSPIGQTSPSSSHIGQPQQPATSGLFPSSDTVLYNGPTIAPQNTLPSSGKPSSPAWNTPIPSVVESRVPLDFSQIQLQPDRQPGFTAHPFGPSNNTRGSDTSNVIQGSPIGQTSPSSSHIGQPLQPATSGLFPSSDTVLYNGPTIAPQNTLPSSGKPSSPAWNTPIPSVVESRVPLDFSQIQLQPDRQPGFTAHPFGPSNNTRGSDTSNVIQGSPIGQTSPSSSHIGQPQQPATSGLFPSSDTVMYNGPTIAPQNTLPSSGKPSSPAWNTPIPSIVESRVPLELTQIQLQPDRQSVVPELPVGPSNTTPGASTSNVINGSPNGPTSLSSSQIDQPQLPPTSGFFPNSDKVLFNGPTITPQNTLPSSGIPSSPAWSAPSPAVVEPRLPSVLAQIQLQPDRQPGLSEPPFGPSNPRGSSTSNLIEGSPNGQSSPTSSQIGQTQQPATSGLFPNPDTVLFNGPTISPQNTLPSSGIPSSPAWSAPSPAVVEPRLPSVLAQIQLQPNRHPGLSEPPFGPSNPRGSSTSNVIEGSPNGESSPTSSQIGQTQQPSTSVLFHNSDTVLFNGPTITPQNTLPSSGILTSPAWNAPSPAVVEPKIPLEFPQVQLQPDRQPGSSATNFGPSNTTQGSSTSNVIQGSPNGQTSLSSSKIGLPQQAGTSGLFPNSGTLLFNGPTITPKNTLPSSEIPSSPASSAPSPAVVESRVPSVSAQVQLKPDRQAGLSEPPFGPSNTTRGSSTSNVIIESSPNGQSSPSSSQIGQPQQPATGGLFSNSDTVLFNVSTITPHNALPSSGIPSTPAWNAPGPAVGDPKLPSVSAQIQLQPDRQPGLSEPPFGPSNTTGGSSTSNVIEGSPNGQSSPSSSKIGRSQQPATSGLFPNSDTVLFNGPTITPQNTIPSSGIPSSPAWSAPSPAVVEPRLSSVSAQIQSQPDRQPGLSEPPFGPTNTTGGSSTSNVIEGAPSGQSSPSSIQIGQPQQPATSGLFPNSDTVLFNGPTITPQNTLPSSGIPSSSAWNGPIPSTVESRVPLELIQIQLQPDRQSVMPEVPVGPSNITPGSNTSNVIHGSPNGPTSLSSSQIDQPQLPPTSGLFPSTHTFQSSGLTITPVSNIVSSNKFISTPEVNAPVQLNNSFPQVKFSSSVTPSNNTGLLSSLQNLSINAEGTPAVVKSAAQLVPSQVQLQPKIQNIVSESSRLPSKLTPGSSSLNIIQDSPVRQAIPLSSPIGQPQQPATSILFPDTVTNSFSNNKLLSTPDVNAQPQLNNVYLQKSFLPTQISSINEGGAPNTLQNPIKEQIVPIRPQNIESAVIPVHGKSSVIEPNYSSNLAPIRGSVVVLAPGSTLEQRPGSKILIDVPKGSEFQPTILAPKGNILQGGISDQASFPQSSQPEISTGISSGSEIYGALVSKPTKSNQPTVAQKSDVTVVSVPNIAFLPGINGSVVAGTPALPSHPKSGSSEEDHTSESDESDESEEVPNRKGSSYSLLPKIAIGASSQAVHGSLPGRVVTAGVGNPGILRDFPGSGTVISGGGFSFLPNIVYRIVPQTIPIFLPVQYVFVDLPQLAYNGIKSLIPSPPSFNSTIQYVCPSWCRSRL